MHEKIMSRRFLHTGHNSTIPNSRPSYAGAALNRAV
jgi:hypothetical protein